MCIPLSIRAKFYAFTGYIPKDLQDLKWNYRPKKEGSTAPTLVIAFAGGAVQMGGIPILEFSRTVSQLEDCDALLLSDPHQAWYLQDCETRSWKGQEEWRGLLNELLPNYKRIIMIGNCLGGTAALLFADLADRVIAFGPQTTLYHSKGKYKLNSMRVPSVISERVEHMIDQSALTCGSVYVYFSPKKDTYMEHYIRNSEYLHVEIVNECDMESIPQWLKKNEQLVQFMTNHIKATPFRK